MPTNVLCKRMATPHARTLKGVRHMCMYLKKHREGANYCTYGRVGLEQPTELVAPYGDKKPHYFVAFVDANLKEYSRTGGVGMLSS